MPHYKDGTPAQIGDIVTGPGYNGSTLIGPVCSISPNIDSCNMSLARPMQISEGEGRRLVIPSTETVTCVTCKDFVKLFALLLALALFASSAMAQGHGFAPLLEPDTVVGPPPDEVSVEQVSPAQPVCTNGRSTATARPAARPIRAVARAVARPAGKAVKAAKAIGRFLRHPFRRRCG